MVVITHDPADVELFADHLILFENGHAVQDLSQSTRGAASSDRVKELLSRLY
jgi:ABC-type polar amino acid transport system ATPase subunit